MFHHQLHLHRLFYFSPSFPSSTSSCFFCAFMVAFPPLFLSNLCRKLPGNQFLYYLFLSCILSLSASPLASFLLAFPSSSLYNFKSIFSLLSPVLFRSHAHPLQPEVPA